ncbi:MAG: TlpA disulfide reductase family protein [Thiohalomonadaceae bacterium]
MIFARSLLLTLFVLGAFTGCESGAPRLKAGDIAPPFELLTMDGDALELADLHGQVVAVRFWADWCPYCRSEMIALEPVYRRLHGEGLEILAVNVAQERATVVNFMKMLDVSYPALMDETSEVARLYGVIGLPMTVFVDRAGRVRGKILGESDASSFETMARSLLSESESTTGTHP